MSLLIIAWSGPRQSLNSLSAGAPLITSLEQRDALVKSCVDVPERGQFMARLRTVGMYFLAKGTAARPDEIRAKLVSCHVGAELHQLPNSHMKEFVLVYSSSHWDLMQECQALDIAYQPKRDQVVSRQPIQLMVWSKRFGKTSGGDKTEYQACGGSREVCLMHHNSLPGICPSV